MFKKSYNTDISQKGRGGGLKGAGIKYLHVPL